MRMPIASSGQTITKEYYIKVLRRLTEGCGKMKAAAAADKCPDLAPCDFWPFPKIKSLLKERRFQSTDEIKENSTKELMKIPKEDFSNCFEKWKEHWEKCVMFQEEYLEGDFEGGFKGYNTIDLSYPVSLPYFTPYLLTSEKTVQSKNFLYLQNQICHNIQKKLKGKLHNMETENLYFQHGLLLILGCRGLGTTTAQGSIKFS
ncbi:hypothetical protein GQR58_025940 [Nymphon striatum]|nr:hypothetical protein GQR58_025940 [Nymphon striatum]